ncbi:unnamed protein product [Echinostoma caproni]|uniref:Neogenin_C domain-containing protein n=1 Tax=Echinostoma caproni TaxID=27848 RepID=A0A183A9Q2_9TREM|nr:unnamed protein product [Echinostoma caproni]
MNARRRSLDKWQEDASKASSLADSPSPGSPSSRSGQLTRSASTNMCCLKEGDSAQMEPCSPGGRRTGVNSMNIAGQIPGNKPSDNGYMSTVARNELGRLTRNGCLSNGSNVSNPNMNNQSTPHINGTGLFNSIHRSASTQATFTPSTPNSNLVNSGHLPGASATNLAHISGAYANNTFVPHHHDVHQLNAATHLYHTHQQHSIQHPHHQGVNIQKPLIQQTPFMERTEMHHSNSTHPTVVHGPPSGALGSVLLRDPTYPHANAPRGPHTFIFPSGGLHNPQAIGAPHLNLFHSGTGANGTVRSHFLMRDLGAGTQFDHHFLNTMSNGQRALTAQAIELCNSLAAANSASLSSGGERPDEQQNSSQNQFTMNPEVKIHSGEIPEEEKTKSDTRMSEEPSSSDEQGSNQTADQMEDVISPQNRTLDNIRQTYFNTSEMETIKGDISCLSDAICELVNSDDADLREALNECDSDESS